MIILDTNVISEAMKESPSPRVARWMRLLPPTQAFTTSTTQAEILYGIELLPRGRRRQGLHAAAAALFEGRFADRILPFDSDAARVFAEISAARRSLGHSIGPFDCQIAAIARTRGAAVATRYIGGFADCGIQLINPFE